MKKKLRITLAICCTITIARGQRNFLIVANHIQLPKDTTVKTQMLLALNGLLNEVEKPNNENPYVLSTDLLEMSVLLDEMKDLRKSKKFGDDNFYKSYLTNLIRHNDSTFLIQIAFIGNRNDTSHLRASFKFNAKKSHDRFYFYSPLSNNTSTWKTKGVGKVTLHYKHTINDTNAKKYFSKIEAFDKKLNAPEMKTAFYCCDNFNEALNLIGVDYKSDYNAQKKNTLTARHNNFILSVNGIYTSDFLEFDPHDLWHSRLHNIVSTKIINRPVDEGTAYLYGGSWGLSWEEILEKFKRYAKENPNADWVAQYNESTNFDPQANFPLNVDFVINALIVQKIEKEKGFPFVIELLSCGNKEQGNPNYFNALEKITGISKSEFSNFVWELIRAN